MYSSSSSNNNSSSLKWGIRERKQCWIVNEANKVLARNQVISCRCIFMHCIVSTALGFVADLNCQNDYFGTYLSVPVCCHLHGSRDKWGYCNDPSIKSHQCKGFFCEFPPPPQNSASAWLHKTVEVKSASFPSSLPGRPDFSARDVAMLVAHLTLFL